MTKKTKTFKRQKKDVREEEEKVTRVKTVCQWPRGQATREKWLALGSAPAGRQRGAVRSTDMTIHTQKAYVCGGGGEGHVV